MFPLLRATDVVHDDARGVDICAANAHMFVPAMAAAQCLVLIELRLSCAQELQSMNILPKIHLDS